MSFHLTIPEQAQPYFDCTKKLSSNDMNLVCTLVLSYITREPCVVTYSKLVNSLHVDEGSIDKCICAIGFLFSECLQQRVNPFDFADTISDVGFGEEITAILEKFYDHLVCLCVLYDIQSLAIKNSDSMERGYKLKGVVSEYIGIRWRLDVELSRQCLYHTYSPSFLLEIASREQGVQKNEYFEVDYASLRRMVKDLQDAVQNNWDVCCHEYRYLMKFGSIVC